jgi:urea transport system substrate-binding protein
VFYTGAALTQKATLAVDYLMSQAGGGVKRFALIGTDDIYQRTTHKILRGYLTDKGVSDADIDEKYIPKDHRNHQVTLANLRWFSLGGHMAIISTLTGDSSVLFYQELAKQGMKAPEVPVLAFFSTEQELRNLDPRSLVGHLAVWSYFMNLQNATNEEFKAKWAFYAKTKNLPGADKPLTNDPMEATYMGVHLWKQAVEQAKSTQTDKVIAAMAGQTFKAPSGFVVKMDERNHHLRKPVFIGKLNTEGQFNVVWKTPSLVNPQPWRSYTMGNDKKPNVPETIR